ncbi:MAG: hypothetical protein ACI8P0_002052 [Planctomycetaceae bacterium]|jgi:hypothetical protein
MTDEELIRDFIRINHSVNGDTIEVRSIGWNGPCEPKSSWIVFAELAADAGQTEIDARIQEALASPEHFRNLR